MMPEEFCGRRETEEEIGKNRGHGSNVILVTCVERSKYTKRPCRRGTGQPFGTDKNGCE